MASAPEGEFVIPINDEFDDTTQATYKPNLFQIVESPTRPGKPAAKMLQPPVASFMDENHRCHFLGAKQAPWLGQMLPGLELWWSSSLTFAADHRPGTGWECSNEIHSGWHGPQQSFGGPAPFNHDHSFEEWHLVIRGGVVPTEAADPGGPIPSQAVWGGPQLTGANGYGYRGGFANGFPYTIEKNKRYDWLFGWHLAADHNAWFEAWCNGVLVVSRTHVPTCYEVINGLSDNYVMTGAYRQGYNGANAFSSPFFVEAGRIFDNEAEAKEYYNALVGNGEVPNPTEPTLVSSSIKSGDSLSGTVDWNVVTTNTDEVEFWANNNQLKIVPTDLNESASMQLDTTKTPFTVGNNALGIVLLSDTKRIVTPNIPIVVTAYTPGPDPEPEPGFTPDWEVIAGHFHAIADEFTPPTK